MRAQTRQRCEKTKLLDYLTNATRAEDLQRGDACLMSLLCCHMQELVKMNGVKRLAGERNPALMHMLADCMSQVAAQTWSTAGTGRWTGILQTMQQFISSEDPSQVEVGLVLYSKLTEWLDQEDLLQQNPEQMYNILVRCMGHSSKQVQIAACKASINFIAVRPPSADHITRALSHLDLFSIDSLRH